MLAGNLCVPDGEKMVVSVNDEVQEIRQILLGHKLRLRSAPALYFILRSPHKPLKDTRRVTIVQLPAGMRATD